MTTSCDMADDEEKDLVGEDDTPKYFKPLLTKNKTQRDLFLETLNKSVRWWHSRSKEDDDIAKNLLRVHSPTIMRLAITCPFMDVRDKLNELVKTIEEMGVVLPHPQFDGPSTFIPSDMVRHYTSSCDIQSSEVQGLYEEAFLKNARLSHMVFCLGYHPKYLDIFIRTLDFIMSSDGPLSLDIRNYLAILAASRHKCLYLVQLQEKEFLSKGGDMNWLKGLNFLPKKILNILHLNKLLCHQPWYVSEKHFEELLIGSDSWSVAELVHAVVIMAFYHSLAGFCLGCGINPEVDSELVDQPSLRHCSNPALGMAGNQGSDTDSETVSPTCSPPTTEFSNYYMLERYTGVETPKTEKQMTDMLKEKLAEVSQEEDWEEEQEVEKDRQFAESVSSFGMGKKDSSPPVPIPVSLQRYLDDADYKHEDFTSTAACTLRAREYSWEDHGFSFLNSLYPQMSELLDDKFRIAFELTYRRLGQDKNIDTKPFREAVWYYIQSIKGIRHDDYNYGMVNKILEIEFKTYIRMVACFPERVTKFDFHDSMTGLEHSEKVHINILVLEARLQAEIIYALKALLKHMK